MHRGGWKREMRAAADRSDRSFLSVAQLSSVLYNPLSGPERFCEAPNLTVWVLELGPLISSPCGPPRSRSSRRTSPAPSPPSVADTSTTARDGGSNDPAQSPGTSPQA